MTPEDALDIAAALEAALPDIPDENAIPEDKVMIVTPHPDAIDQRLRQVGDKVQWVDSDTGLENLTDFMASSLPSGEPILLWPVRWVGEHIWAIDSETDLTPAQIFSGDNKAELVDFIAFCRQGGFVVCDK